MSFTTSNGSARLLAAQRLAPLHKALAAVLLLGAAPASTMAATTWTVTSSADSGGTCPSATSCTLRHAIASAASGDTIKFSSAVNKITLTSNTPLLVNSSITIDGRNTVAVNGNHKTTVFLVSSGVTGELTGLTIQNAYDYYAQGGGIYNKGTLTVTGSTLSGNSASTGGGISNHGTLTVTNSTISGNSGIKGAGGGIANYGTLTVTNSTFYGNTAFYGGGIVNNSSTMTLTNDTLSDDTAALGGAGIYNYRGTATLSNTIIAEGADGCNGNHPDDGGGNIDTGTNCNFTAGTSHSNVFNLSLGTLANNGGPTKTMLPGTGSAAINAIICANAPLTDQRGMIRPDPASATLATPCDIGAVEANSIPDEIFTNGFER